MAPHCSVVRLGLLVAFLGGCGSSQKVSGAGAQDPSALTVRATAVDDEHFGPAVAQLLRESEATSERQGLLVGVVRRQLIRAGERFAAGHPDAGLDAVIGAFNLVRAGEFHPAMLEGAEPALRGAVAAVARNGNEGQAVALYTMLKQVLAEGPDLRDVEAHLAALADWVEKTRSPGPLQAAASDHQNATQRALLEPTPEAVRAAQEAAVEWIRRAIAYGREQRPPTNTFERDEAMQYYRAVRTGPWTIAALYLRNGDAERAAEAMESEVVARVVSPNLHEALQRAGNDDDVDAWFELFRIFDGFSGEQVQEVPFDADLAAGAAWGAAVELLRLEPDAMRGVMPIATLLLRYWMADAAMPLLEPVVVEEKVDPRALSWTLTYVLQAVINEEAVGSPTGARRVFAAARPFLDVARKPGLADRVTPHPARLDYVMGAIEARAGELRRARDLLMSAVAEEKTIDALQLLAAIDRQRGAPAAALKSLQSVVRLATESSEPAVLAETHASMFELQRELGNPAAAATALSQALKRSLDARELARSTGERASAERVLARVLERYGDDAGARRAIQRAYDASGNDMRQLTATVLEASRRALTARDLKGAREAARRAVEADLADEDVVYVALWLRLLERQLKVPSDGTAEAALAAMDEDDHWPAKLRAWGDGKISDQALFEAARDRVQQTEALFYTAMAQPGGPNAAGVRDKLAQVASSQAIQLVEVVIARDLLAQGEAPPLPADVDVP